MEIMRYQIMYDVRRWKGSGTMCGKYFFLTPLAQRLWAPESPIGNFCHFLDFLRRELNFPTSSQDDLLSNQNLIQGDSGGPLFCPWYDSGYGTEERYQLHGIYSYGRCGSDIQKPSVFTRVSHYREWIQKTLGEYDDLITGPWIT